MYGINKVAEITGIPAVTLRAWERRYHIISPLRTENGSRLYTDKHIEDILWVKTQKEKNKIPIHKAFELLKEKEELHTPIPTAINENKYERHVQLIFHLMRSFDLEQANKELNLCFSMYDFEDVFHYIITPILHLVGDEWAKGSITVSQEHLISHFFERRLHSFFQTLSIDPFKPKAIAFCSEGELHQIGLLLFSLFLKRRGIDVLFLGQHTPLDSLEPLLQMNNIKLICISVKLEENKKGLEEFIDHLKSVQPKLLFAIGGLNKTHLPSSIQEHHISGDLESWKSWFQQINW